MITEMTNIGKGKHMVMREDGHFVCLYYREMKGLEFEVGKTPTEEQWAIAKKSVFTRGKKRIFHLLARKDYTEHEIRTKLVKEKYDADDVQGIIDYFMELGFVNDTQYVLKYYRCYKDSKSRRIIDQKLKLKGISSNFIKEVLEDEVDEQDAYNAAKRQAIKKYGGKELTREDYPKMVQFLMRKGFDYGLCKGIVEELLKGEVDEW